MLGARALPVRGPRDANPLVTGPPTVRSRSVQSAKPRDKTVKRSRGALFEGWVEERVTSFRYLMIVIAAVVGLAQVAEAAEAKWLPGWAAPTGLIVLIVATLVEGVWGVRRAKRRRAEDSRRLDLDKQMVSVLVTVSKLTGIDVDIPGCNVWSIETEARTPRLHREYRRRLSDFPQASKVEWTQGKGVIGRCWEEGEPVHVDWTKAQSKFAKREELSEAAWKGMTERERWGFERHEYLRSIRKYSEILAVPIKDDDGHVLGVVSVDIPSERAGGSSSCLGSGDVREVMTHAAISLRDFV